MAGWGAADIAGVFYSTGAIGCAVLLGFSLMMTYGHGSVNFVLLAAAVATFCPSMIGALAAMSSARIEPHIANAVPFFFGLAIVLNSLKRVASALLRVFSLPSRFKYVTFQGYAGLLQSFCDAVSPFLVIGLSAGWDLPFETSGDWALSDVFATSNVYLLLPFACLSFLCNLLTLKPLADEGVVPWYANVSVVEPQTDGDVDYLKRKLANLWSCRTPLRKPGGTAPERAERAASARRPPVQDEEPCRRARASSREARRRWTRSRRGGRARAPPAAKEILSVSSAPAANAPRGSRSRR